MPQAWYPKLENESVTRKVALWDRSDGYYSHEVHGDQFPASLSTGGRLKVAPVGSDETNSVQKVAKLYSPGTLLAATGATLTGISKLARLIVANNHATTATTVSVYDNTNAASGTKLCPDFTVLAGQIANLELDVPYGFGVYVVLTGGTPSAMGYSQVVA